MPLHIELEATSNKEIDEPVTLVAGDGNGRRAGREIQFEPSIEPLHSKPKWVYCATLFPANCPWFPCCPSAPPDFSLPPRPSPPLPSPSLGPLRDCYTCRRTELGNRASSGVLCELGLVDSGDIKNGAAAQHLVQTGMRPPTTRIRMRSPTFSLSLSLSFSLLCLFVSLSKNPTLSLLCLFVFLLRAPASSMRHPVTVGDVEGGLLPVLVLVEGLGVERGFGWSVAAGGSRGGGSPRGFVGEVVTVAMSELKAEP
ncbi:hypothetical protein TIFTF001_044669 [Ficus carica]|uniref:Uncharacterized protein n=1 Tax=Ficus carica TaxID=3494 RepID=A0AA87Z9T3_FICCA|nr:hypothetical protein TIFTF001_044669 [Ficus carica]